MTKEPAIAIGRVLPVRCTICPATTELSTTPPIIARAVSALIRIVTA